MICSVSGPPTGKRSRRSTVIWALLWDIKWTNGQRTDHPCVIIFVPQKTLPWLIPDEEKAPSLLEGPNGQWCYTDVVTGGKATSLEEIDPLPELSPENQQIIQELKSGRVGLIGGIQLAFYVDGIEDNEHAALGTAGIAVREKSSGQIGFLTNQHVADAPGRRIYHPWHGYSHIGTTLHTRTHENVQILHIDYHYVFRLMRIRASGNNVSYSKIDQFNSPLPVQTMTESRAA